MDGELHVELDDADFLAVFPLKGEGRARLIGTVQHGRATEQREHSTWADVSTQRDRAHADRRRRA